MYSYFEYVHNLKGEKKFEHFSSSIKEAVVKVLVRNIENYNSLEEAIINYADKEVLGYLSEHLNLKVNYKSVILTTNFCSYIDEVDFKNVRAIINLRKINHIQHPNGLFNSVNKLLPDAGIYIGSAFTYDSREIKICNSFGKQMGRLICLMDFIINRVVPRIPYLDRLYYILTNGRFHCISLAETLGRLAYCGFEIIDYKTINRLTYFVAIKVRNPLKAKNPSFYPIVKLSRIGKDGRVINVYKFRTMHPYSEFIQDYIIRLNGYNDKGKPANDFRITRWGSFMRKLWIDELPQLYNVLRGEMKLVGLRPLSQVRFNEFPDDLKKERIKYKPGCIPPYVALCMPDEEGNIEAERIYIRDFEKQPYITDIMYFIRAIYNIITNKIRSA
jgi:hypothetical protein